MAATRSACQERADCLAASLAAVIFAALLITFIVGVVLDKANAPAHMRYYVSIDSVSGLNLGPSKDLVLDPQFNLTLRLVSSRPSQRVCMGAGTYLVVAYHCVPPATSAATPQPLCVEAENSSFIMPVVAKGTGVRLPGYMMDSLVADLRNGVQAFDVQFGPSDIVSCGFRRVGDVAAECGFWQTCHHTQDQPTTTTPPPLTGEALGRARSGARPT